MILISLVYRQILNAINKCVLIYILHNLLD